MDDTHTVVWGMDVESMVNSPWHKGSATQGMLSASPGGLTQAKSGTREPKRENTRANLVRRIQ